MSEVLVPGGHFIVATHLSSLSSPPPISIVAETTRQNSAQSTTSQENDFPVDHATYSSAITTPETGTVVLRVIHGGLIIELASISAPVPPLRFVFPSPVLPAPSLFLFDNAELRLIAITENGSLHRISIPVQNATLWQHEIEEIWQREYFIRNFGPESAKECLVHVQSPQCVVMGLPTGDLLRLEADLEMVNYDGSDVWNESVFHQGSFFSSLSSFLHSAHPNGSAIVSIASDAWPTDILNTWTLSRDRTLRLWKSKLGCVASKVLPASLSSKDLGNSTSSSAKHILLDGDRQNLIKIFSLPSVNGKDAPMYALVFIPTPSSTTGGYFCLLDTSADQFIELGIIECKNHTAYCHIQDFLVNKNTLYVLWDKQGQSVVDITEINIDQLNESSANWTSTCYAQQPELTPAYMEELLLSPGSLSEKFLGAVLKPGVFSVLTLRAALDKYIDSCLSLPGPVPPQLNESYPTLAESIAATVGCTVTLNRDPHTGGYQHANYWIALKRDWEGFVARCREIERSARWPLSIAVRGPDEVIVLERERIGCVAVEDAAMRLRRLVERNQELDDTYSLMVPLWNLRSALGPGLLSLLESGVAETLHQESAYSYADTLQELASKLRLDQYLGLETIRSLNAELRVITDIRKSSKVVLDCVSGFRYHKVKTEEMEVDLSSLPSSSDWRRLQAAAYVQTTVEARYDICLCLVAFLLLQAEVLPTWRPRWIDEILAVFRGLSMLKSVTSQPVEKRSTNPESIGTSSDDVVTQLRNMNVSSAKRRPSSNPSLLQLLITHAPESDTISVIAHTCLERFGITQPTSPANATKAEVGFCNTVLSNGFPGITRDLLSWLPRVPAVTYLQSQALLKLGRIDDAAELLEKLAGAYTDEGVLMCPTDEDGVNFNNLLPLEYVVDSKYSFYLYAVDIFQTIHIGHAVKFSKLAIHVAPPTSDTSSLWNTVVKGSTDLGLYDEAYAAIMSMPYERQKRDCACQLAVRMCEDNVVAKLMTYDFVGMADEVEAALSFKARNADPRALPCYSRILYTWFTRRSDYRNASLTMYQRARKLKDCITDSPSFVSLAEDQLEALSVAINSLHLVDEKNAWILMPVVQDPTRTRKKLSKHIPESKYLSGKHDAEIIHLGDMEYERALLHAQIDSIKREPSILSSPEYLLPPSVIVMRLAQSNQYNQAMAIARSLKVDMIDLFTHLTNQCIRLTRNPGAVLEEDTSGWLLTDKAASWQGTPSDRGWRFLQQSLKRHDGPENDYRYAKASLETILGMSDSQTSPPWLIDIFEKYQPEYLIRISLRYDNIADAVNYTYALVLKSDKQFAREVSKDAFTTWLPYTLIDQVLIAADALIDAPPNLPQLRAAINSRVKRMQKRA